MYDIRFMRDSASWEFKSCRRCGVGDVAYDRLQEERLCLQCGDRPDGFALEGVSIPSAWGPQVELAVDFSILTEPMAEDDRPAFAPDPLITTAQLAQRAAELAEAQDQQQDLYQKRAGQALAQERADYFAEQAKKQRRRARRKPAATIAAKPDSLPNPGLESKTSFKARPRSQKIKLHPGVEVGTYWYEPRPRRGDDRCNYCGVLVASEQEAKAGGLRGLVLVIHASVGVPHCRFCYAQIFLDTTKYVRVKDLTNIGYGYSSAADLNIKWLTPATKQEVIDFNLLDIRDADDFLRRPSLRAKARKFLKRLAH